MPSLAVEVHPLAADEAEAAERWYRDLKLRLPTSVTPDAFCCAGSLFFVVYRVFSRHVQVVAVAHARRRPHYWLDR
jgi:hypothetical protein